MLIKDTERYPNGLLMSSFFFMREVEMRNLMIAAILSTIAVPAMAQSGYSVSNAPDGTVTTTVFSVDPVSRVAAADYVKMSADALNYRIAADRLALSKAQRDDVKRYARASLAEAERQRGALMASLVNQDRKIAKPATRLSSQRQASIDLLRKAPRASFDTLYLQQVSDTAPAMWALNKGYAQDGADPILRQVATTYAPVIEQRYQGAKGLIPAAFSN